MKLGRMLKDMPKNPGGGYDSNQYKKATPAHTAGVASSQPTYSELGINYKDASAWMFVAEQEMETKAKVVRMKAGNAPITKAKIVNATENRHEVIHVQVNITGRYYL